jgi:hypothetical protein
MQKEKFELSNTDNLSIRLKTPENKTELKFYDGAVLFVPQGLNRFH